MKLPGFQAEAALDVPARGYRGTWRPPAVRVVTARPDCLDCRECPMFCELGSDACEHCWLHCESCPRIPEPIFL